MSLFNFRSIKSISSEGVETDVVSPRPFAPPVGPYSEFSEIPATYDYGTHTVHYPRFAYLLPQRLFKYTLSSLSVSRMLPAYIEDNFEVPDICHAGHIHYDGYALLPYCKEHEVPLTVMGRGKILNNYEETSSLGKRKIRETLEYADKILCVSESLAQIARSIVGEEKAIVLPNGADPSRYPTRCKSEIRAELGIPPETTVLLFCGGYTKRKGLYEIFEALDGIHHEDVQLVFIGHYGDLRTRLISSLEASPHESYRVLWEVPPLALRRWFTVADVFMLPSHAEGRPNTIYEAMASDTPVVASSVSGIPEQVADGETGILIPPKDSSALVDALNRLIEDPAGREEMGVKGRERLIANDWTWKAHGKRLRNIHESILSG
jgi:glycosyltransferase involved in cell wall biosynthesis